MHENQIEVTPAMVTQLICAQFPQWTDLPLSQVASHGTVNALFRIGTELVARLPIERGDVETKRVELMSEMDAARRLLPVSPVATPEPVAMGEPDADYPLPWCVYRWIPGAIASQTDAASAPRFAEQLAGFVRAVRSLPTQGRSFHGTRRGGVLTQHDAYVTTGLQRSRGMIDTQALANLWDRLRATPHAYSATWTHGDLMPGNMLAGDHNLTGVIDVGQFGVADPALDLQPAWNFFTPPARAAFRRALGCDDNEWDRGKGWAFAQAIGCLWYYRETNPVMSETAHHTLQALLDDDREQA